MKTLKYFAIVILLSASVTACKDSGSKALGGSADTVAKLGTGDPNNTRAADSTKTDSLNKGNADPSGRGASDTLNARPIH
ncbi:hypothetical protein NAF17_16640 [Mucilaginibacter sp. RB4R14]|uniref:hypothetical protein n=1 Tax=Mucilaginibacter aurantiaciroseus TaxID=2949308 RepID=UPI0020905C17|nr:hypothetical protein [Mucilaginibacter aurantiaciroseus]MCO5937175.1 hypothetical protein [Mucilaginibacter aurantiaciroseus]